MNHCTFDGRLSGTPEERQLPSGDAIVIFRIVVPREGEQRIDTIDCVVTSARLRRRVAAVPDGTLLHVEGALRRRFWRGPAGIASRYEVAASVVRRAS